MVVDLLHWGLNAVYDPISGPIDDALHGVMAVAPWLYALCLLLGTRAVVHAVSQSTAPLERGRWAWILLAYSAFQATSLVFAPRYPGSSIWQPTYPPFVGGLIMATLVLRVARPLLTARSARAMTGATALLWIVGQLCTDLLAFTEGTARGTGPLWRSAASSLLSSMGGLTVLAGMPIGWAVYERSPVVILAFLGPPAVLVWVWMARTAGARLDLAVWSLALSSFVLMVRLWGWASFVLD